MKMKIVTIVLLLAMTVGMMTGCKSDNATITEKTGVKESESASESTSESTSESSSSNENEKVTITILQSKIEANEGYNKAIAAYEKLHPEVTINLEAITGNDFSVTIKTKMQFDPPTIFSVGGFNDLKDYGSYMEDLTDMPILENALKGTTDTFTVDNKIYALPLYSEGYGFVINREMFEYAGVTFDSMLTFDGMKKGFDTLKAKIDSGEMKSKYPNLEAVMEYPIKELWIAGDHDANVCIAHDFSTAMQAYNAATLPGTGFEDYKKMVDFQASYTSNADNTSNLLSIDYTTSLEGGLAIERVAAIKQGCWVAPAVQTVDPAVLSKLDMLPYSLPGFSEGKYFLGVSGYWSICNQASEAEKKAAKDFINWLLGDLEGQKILVEDCKFIPPYTNFGDLKANDPLAQRLMDAASSGNTLDGFVYFGAPSSWGQQVAGIEVQKYLAGVETWDEVTKNCIEQWSTIRESQK